MSGDTIDLSPLLMVCSTISLGSEIPVLQDSLYVLGAGAAFLTIDGNETSRIFHHTGSGTLSLDGLTITNGFYASANNTSDGGCIASLGSVFLERSVVSHCYVGNMGTGAARGGGVFTKATLALNYSKLTNNEAYVANYSGAAGGGAYALGGLSAKYSTISDNAAFDNNGTAASRGGGAFIFLKGQISGSTISGNYSEYSGGLHVAAAAAYSMEILNSTISANRAAFSASGIGMSNSQLRMSNSTVVFNKSQYGPSSETAGVYLRNASLILSGSILAGNAANGVPMDLGADNNPLVSGADNLVVEANNVGLPANTLRDCPQLQALADNGGPTRTHALKQTSPAIDHGNNAAGLNQDQRLALRTAGAQTDIGSVEWQPGETDERLFVGGFDGLCDQ